MRILIINPAIAYIRGGAEVNDLNLGKAMKRAGHEVIHMDAVDKKISPVSNDAETSVVSVHMNFFLNAALKAPFPLGALLRNLYYLRFVRACVGQQADILRSADLILLSGKPVLALLKRHTPATVLLSVRGASKLHAHFFHRLVDGIIFWGGCDRDHTERYLKSLRYVACAPAIDSSVFFPGPDTAMVRERLRCSTSTVVLMYVGRLDPVKQVERIIEACVFLKSSGIDIRLVVVGNGSMRAQLERRGNEALGTDAVFTGWLVPQEVAYHLRAADIFVMSSQNENHPIALMEAVACGTFCVTPDVGRARKIVERGGVGCVYEPNEQYALNNTLIEVIRSARYVKSSGGLSPATIRIRTWDDNAQSIVYFFTLLNLKSVRQ